MQDFEIRGPRPTRGVFVHNVIPRHFADEPPRTPRYSEDGFRVFNPRICAFELVREPILPGKSPPRPTLPVSDGSGVRWEVRETSGQLVWSFEAADFDRALVEKRRLCHANGWKSGWARLYPVE